MPPYQIARGLVSSVERSKPFARFTFATVVGAGPLSPSAVLGAGYMSFDEALAGWRASAGHDANLLMASATRFGVALAKNPSDAYGAYWAMEVGAEQRSGGAPEVVWLFPLPVVLIKPQ